MGSMTALMSISRAVSPVLRKLFFTIKVMNFRFAIVNAGVPKFVVKDDNLKCDLSLYCALECTRWNKSKCG